MSTAAYDNNHQTVFANMLNITMWPFFKQCQHYCARGDGSFVYGGSSMQTVIAALMREATCPTCHYSFYGSGKAAIEIIASKPFIRLNIKCF